MKKNAYALAGKKSIFNLVALMIIASGGAALADNTAVVPAQYANTEPGGEIGEAINGYQSTTGEALQYVISGADMAGLAGQTLTGLAFRLSDTYDPSLPQISYSDYTIELSPYSGGALSDTFDNNLVNPVTVQSGPFTFDAGAFPTGATGSTPNGFGDFITFQNDYSYSGGNLLVTIFHTQPTVAGNVSYWSADAYSASISTIIGHSDTATTSSTTVGVAPVTEFTTQALNSNGTPAVPEPSSLGLLGTGAVATFGFLRRNRKA